MSSHRGQREAVFPITDHLPLGTALGAATGVALARSGLAHGGDGVSPGGKPTIAAENDAKLARPFGLRFATVPADGVEVDLGAVRYDEVGQVMLAREGTVWVPLIAHSMAMTLRSTGQIPREDEIHDKT